MARSEPCSCRATVFRRSTGSMRRCRRATSISLSTPFGAKKPRACQLRQSSPHPSHKSVVAVSLDFLRVFRGAYMTDVTASTHAYPGKGAPKLDQKTSPITMIVFFALLAAGIGYGVHGLVD